VCSPWARLAQDAAETPVSSDAFLFAIEIGNAAISHRTSIQSPLAFRVALRRPDGRVATFRLADVPENRFALAIREQFGNGPTFIAILNRWFACQSLLGIDARMYRYIVRQPGGRLRVTDALLQACAPASRFSRRGPRPSTPTRSSSESPGSPPARRRSGKGRAFSVDHSSSPLRGTRG